MRNLQTPKWLDRILVGLIVTLTLVFGLFGPPMVLTGQGRSMEGPRGLRDGAREVVLRLWLFFDIHEDGIYAFRAKDELWIKRAAEIQGDYIWFLGDNQATDEDGSPESVDSRELGWIHRSQVVGIRVFSLPRIFDGPTEVEIAGFPSGHSMPSEEVKVDARLNQMRNRMEQKSNYRKNGGKPLFSTQKALWDFNAETGEEFPERRWDIIPPYKKMGPIREIEVVVSSIPKDLIPPKIKVSAYKDGRWMILCIIGGGEHTILTQNVEGIRLEHLEGDPPRIDEIHVF